MQDATRKQQRILDFIVSWQEAQGVIPSFQEIANHFKLRSVNSITKQVRFLRQKGLLENGAGKARSLRVVSPLAKLRGRVVDIPLLGVIPAGKPDALEQDPDGCVSVDMASIGFTPQSIPNAVAIKVVGNSMIGEQIVDGDIAIIERGADARTGQIVVAYVDGEMTLKTLIVEKNKTFLRAANPKFKDIHPSFEMVIYGVFRALLRRAKD